MEYRKFYVLAKDAQIYEYSFGDECQNIFDFSPRGQLCLVRSNKLNACTINLLDAGVDYTAIDNAATEWLDTSPDGDTIKFADVAAVSQYTVEEQAAKSN